MTNIEIPSDRTNHTQGDCLWNRLRRKSRRPLNKAELPSTFSVAGSSVLVIEAVLQLLVFKSIVYSFRRIYVITPSLEVKTSAVLPSSSTISYAPGVTVSAAEFMAI